MSTLRHVLTRTAALAWAAVLVTGVVALTVWGLRTPTPAAGVTAVAVPAPARDTVQVCQLAPTNSIGGIDLVDATASTVITPTHAGAALTYDGTDLDDTEPTTLTSADGGLLVNGPVDGTTTSAVGVVTTVTTGGDLRGLTASACAQSTAVAWIVGGAADPGSSAQLRLTNPGTTPVTASVTVYGSVGRLSLPSNGQVTVAPGETRAVLLETAAGSDPRLAVSIEADGGTLAAALASEELDGETPAGVDIITPGAAPSTDLVVPGVVLVDPADQGQSEGLDGATSSDSPKVRVVNPSDQTATVKVSTVGPGGEEALSGATDLTVDPGAVFDVSLDGVPAGSYGVHITSDIPVAGAVQLVRSAGEYPEASGALVHDQAWAQATAVGTSQAGQLAVPRGGGLTSTVVLTNASDSTVSITVTSADGSWTQDVEVPAHRTVEVDVPDDVTAVTLGGAGALSGQVGAATVVTAEATGEVAGTLISVIAAQGDATNLAARRILVH